MCNSLHDPERCSVRPGGRSKVPTGQARDRRFKRAGNWGKNSTGGGGMLGVRVGHDRTGRQRPPEEILRQVWIREKCPVDGGFS